MKHEYQAKLLASYISIIVLIIIGGLLVTTFSSFLHLNFLDVCIRWLVSNLVPREEWIRIHTIPLLFIGLSLLYKFTTQIWKNAHVLRKLKKAPSLYIEDGDILIEYHLVKSERPVAFTVGFLRPRIVISDHLYHNYPSEELRAILLHEYYHQIKKDPLKIMVLRSLVTTLWFIPILRTAMRNYETLKELLADEFSIRQMNSSLPLGSAILRMFRYQSKEGNGQIAFTDGSIELRIQHILSETKVVPKINIKEYVISSFVIILLVSIAGSCI